MLDKYITNHSLIKNAKLPTLKTVEKHSAQSGDGIKTEDLNYCKNIIFVSPNSVNSESQKLLRALSGTHIHGNIASKVYSEYEQRRFDTKLIEIIDFDQFIKNTKQDILRASELKLQVDFDSYFFGSDINSQRSQLEYKIVDLDNIYVKSQCKTDQIHQYNIEEFDRAIRGFIEHFVDINSQQNYLALL